MNNKLWIKAFAGGENMDKNGKNTNQKVKMTQNYVCSRRGGCRRTQYRVVAERNF